MLCVPVDDGPVDDADVEADVEAGVEADSDGDEQAAAADIRVSIAMIAVVALARIFMLNLLPRWLRREPSVCRAVVRLKFCGPSPLDGTKAYRPQSRKTSCDLAEIRAAAGALSFPYRASG